MATGTLPAAETAHDLYAWPLERAEPDVAVTDATACSLCGSEEVTPGFRLADSDLQIVVCADCGLGRLHPEPSPERIASFYPNTYYGDDGRKFTGVVERALRFVAARHARRFAKSVPEGGRVLDVGCGRGVTIGALAKAGYEAHGFELSADAVTGIDPRVNVRVASSLVEADYPDAYFDQVVVWHVLEHVPDPRAAIEEVHRILKPGGSLVVAVPNFSSLQARWAGDAWFHLDPPRHLFQFTERALRELVTDVGFDCGRTHHFSLRQNPFGWLQSALNKLPGLPRNGLYAILHANGRGRRPFSAWTSAALFAAGAALLPFALTASVAAAVLRSGATMHVVAKRRSS